MSLISHPENQLFFQRLDRLIYSVKTRQNPSHGFSCSAVRTVALSFATVALVACHLMAAEPPAPRKIATVEGITEYQFDNGLRALLFPDNSQSKVTVNLTVLVGRIVARPSRQLHYFRHRQSAEPGPSSRLRHRGTGAAAPRRCHHGRTGQGARRLLAVDEGRPVQRRRSCRLAGQPAPSRPHHALGG